jgi:hypothetical protein
LTADKIDFLILTLQIGVIIVIIWFTFKGIVENGVMICLGVGILIITLKIYFLDGLHSKMNALLIEAGPRTMVFNLLDLSQEI